MELPDTIVLGFDGACEKNPGGLATYGWTLEALSGESLAEGSGVAHKPGPGSTNNVAEYVALGMGLKYLADAGWRGTLQVVGDSKLVVEQVNGRWNCNAEHLKKLRDRCLELLEKVGASWTIKWVDRGQNEKADGLSRRAWEQETGKLFPQRPSKLGHLISPMCNTIERMAAEVRNYAEGMFAGKSLPAETVAHLKEAQGALAHAHAALQRYEGK